ncbi:MAG: aspartate/glutamate racemase family protein [Desulfohalobiaceae bacterium]|nr:aspartate/glutamate racemase family protein [Desulfohalobiaceae bacterium]
MQELLDKEGLTPDIIRRVAMQAFLAEQAGAELIVFTCSSTSPAVNTVREMSSIPILKIDDPLAAKAVSIGHRIGIVCTVQSTLLPSQNLIREHAAQQGKEVEIRAELESEAFQAIKSGDRQLHDQKIKEAAIRVSQQVEVVVLAQASMSHLTSEIQKNISVPVVSSPDLCVEELVQHVNQDFL